MNDAWQDFVSTAAVALLNALAVAVIVALVTRRLGRRYPVARYLTRAAAVPFRLLLLVIALTVAVHRDAPWSAREDLGRWVDLATHVGIIITAAWLVGVMVLSLEDMALRRYRLDAVDNLAARRAKTQTAVIRRVTLVGIVILAMGAVLLSFPGVSAAGRSVLASAGIISVIAAVAAQSTLSNLIAGLQIAFSGSIRYGDAVIVEDEWGWVDEITLSYVVVRLWDDRNMVLPATYFTTTPFQNWTRKHSELLGSVEFDVDWRVSPDGMRAELDRILPTTELWDGRTKVLQVTDAVGGWVRIRILVTAKDAPTLFDLRCFVRERMVDWLQSADEGGLPRFRVESVNRQAPRRASEEEATGLFSGDQQGDERAARITGQMPALDEDGRARE
ncbi:mechanosensitive ion channel family protein [Aeromicrobium wangtongii]|uniref:Mechanosensitive ion channel family protein n=1 Tax=Aeromicrobium wangtongii TaxID=2969247 RepID=A0ABY5M658_9ACTN|nr:mechanosensitive ion channel family protein [Aeromicrobium wangtongii]MCD9198420.1 mechanosensitive ion channel family protein [Aeromicrobium wangtongii]UUP12449.1 mechanosensitive ion channel family protein [Aeromicrobium wangtongii]